MSVKFDKGGDTYIGIFSENLILKVVFRLDLKSKLKRELRRLHIKELYDKLYAISIFIAIEKHITNGDMVHIDKDYSEKVKLYSEGLIRKNRPMITCKVIVNSLRGEKRHMEPHKVARQEIKHIKKIILDLTSFNNILSYIKMLS